MLKIRIYFHYQYSFGYNVYIKKVSPLKCKGFIQVYKVDLLLIGFYRARTSDSIAPQKIRLSVKTPLNRYLYIKGQ